MTQAWKAKWPDVPDVEAIFVPPADTPGARSLTQGPAQELPDPASQWVLSLPGAMSSIRSQGYKPAGPRPPPIVVVDVG
jgi:hypothetical protein